PYPTLFRSYLVNILRQGHESVLEHASVTFYVEGVSRALLAELTRHRHLSFSVVSERYVGASQLDMMRPPIMDELDTETRNRVGDILVTQDQSAQQSYEEIAETLTEAGYKRKKDSEAPRVGDSLEPPYQSAQRSYEEIVEILTEAGYTRKQAREAARAVLPNDTASPLIVTGNLRAWRDVLKKRHHVAADREIQRFAGEVLRHLRRIAPNSVQDIPNKPYGSEE